MTVRAHIGHDWTVGGIGIVFQRGEPTPYIVYAPGHMDSAVMTPQGGESVNAELEPLRLPDDEALALLEALTRHYHGAGDTRSLRNDLDAERKRVDTLVAELIHSHQLLGGTLAGVASRPGIAN